MTETLTIVEALKKLSDVGFGILMGLVLFGNFMGVWVWGKLHNERIASLEAAYLKIEIEKNEWKGMALGLLNPLEDTLKKRSRVS